MSEDPRYPIYSVELCWTQDGDPSQYEGQRWWPTDPGPGRIWNSVAPHFMYKEDPGEEWVRNHFLTEWGPGYLTEHAEKIANPSDLRIRRLRRYEETWCLEWFSHKTFDVGQTDAEALASFARYVMRHEHYQDWHHDERPEGWVCLMGAEDRWRWHGGNQPKDERTDPPCRCKHCQKQGVLRINH